MALVGVQRWAITLSAYNYTIQYVPGNNNANVDIFNRLPLGFHTYVTKRQTFHLREIPS